MAAVKLLQAGLRTLSATAAAACCIQPSFSAVRVSRMLLWCFIPCCQEKKVSPKLTDANKALYQKRIVWLNGSVDSSMAKGVVEQLLHLEMQGDSQGY